MPGNFDGIKNRKFGIEIEMTGITRCEAAKAIVSANTSVQLTDILKLYLEQSFVGSSAKGR